MNLLFLCPAVPRLPLQGHNVAEGRESKEIEALGKDIEPDIIDGPSGVGQGVLREEKSGARLTGVLTGAAAEGEDGTVNMKAEAEKAKGTRVLPPEDSPPDGKVPVEGQNRETEQNRVLTSSSDAGPGRQLKNRSPELEKAQDDNPIRAPGSDTGVKGSHNYRPEGEMEGPDIENNRDKPGAVRYDTETEVQKTGPWNDTGQVLQSQKVGRQNLHREAMENDVLNQVAEKMKVMSGARKSEISLQLVPERLGRVKIRLTVTDGVLNGKIVVQNHETKALFQANIVKLQENLEQQGIPVNKLLVYVGRDGGYGQQQFLRDNRQAYHAKNELRAYMQDENRELLTWRGEGTIELLA